MPGVNMGILMVRRWRRGALLHQGPITFCTAGRKRLFGVLLSFLAVRAGFAVIRAWFVVLLGLMGFACDYA